MESAGINRHGEAKEGVAHRRSSERGDVGFPASSPHVVAVGGTRLSLGAGSAWAGEDYQPTRILELAGRSASGGLAEAVEQALEAGRRRGAIQQLRWRFPTRGR